MDPIFVLPIIIGNLVAGFVVGKYQERRDWNEMLAEKNMTPEHWKNLPVQGG